MADDDDRLNAMALDLCARATVHRLKADAVELAELIARLDEETKRRLLALLFDPEV